MSRATDARWGGEDSSALSSALGEERIARAFAAARRHSRLVRVLRTALPLGAVGAVIILATMGLYRTFGSALGRLSIGGVSIDGTKITMDRPRLTGVRQDGRSYVINAAKAIQDVKHPTLVDLADITGDIDMADHDTLHLTATSGRYDTESEALDLSGAVRLRNHSYNIELRSAHIEFKTGAYRTQEPVTVVTSSGSSVVADSATVRDSGKEVAFEGHVKSVIRSNDGGSEPAPPIKENQP